MSKTTWSYPKSQGGAGDLGVLTTDEYNQIFEAIQEATRGIKTKAIHLLEYAGIETGGMDWLAISESNALLRVDDENTGVDISRHLFRQINVPSSGSGRLRLEVSPVNTGKVYIASRSAAKWADTGFVDGDVLYYWDEFSTVINTEIGRGLAHSSYSPIGYDYTNNVQVYSNGSNQILGVYSYAAGIANEGLTAFDYTITHTVASIDSVRREIYVKASASNSFKKYDLDTGALVATMQPVSSSVTAIHAIDGLYSHGGSTVLTTDSFTDVAFGPSLVNPIAYDPNREAYVSTTFERQVDRYSLSNLLDGPQISDLPGNGMAFNSDDNIVYALDLPSLHKINKIDGSTVSTITLSVSNVYGLSYDSVNKLLYTIDTNTDEIVKLHPDTGAEIDRFAAPNTNVFGVTYDRVNDRLYAQDVVANIIYRLDPDTGAIQGSYIEPEALASSIEYNPYNDQILCFNSARTEMLSIDALTGNVITRYRLPKFYNATFVTFDTVDSLIYAFEGGNIRWVTFDISGGKMKHATRYFDGGNVFPWCAYSKSRQQVFVWESGELYYIDDGSPQWHHIGTHANIEDITFDDVADELYLLHGPTSEVRKINPDTGAQVGSFTVPDSSLKGIACDPSGGRIFIAKSSKTYLRTISGAGIGTWSYGATGPMAFDDRIGLLSYVSNVDTITTYGESGIVWEKKIISMGNMYGLDSIAGTGAMVFSTANGTFVAGTETRQMVFHAHEVTGEVDLTITGTTVSDATGELFKHHGDLILFGVGGVKVANLIYTED